MSCYSCGDRTVGILGSILAIIGFLLYIPLLWLPNYIYDFFFLYHPDFFRKRNTPENHAKKVFSVQEQVRKWNQNGRKNKMCTSRPSWKALSVRHINKKKFTQIKLDLEDIIEIDTVNQIIRVEPGIQMGTLTHRLVPLGWTIPVVPEFEILTVGGLINGAGLESSSHKYGIFATTCLEYEMVLSDGSLVTCSEKENSDLFYAIPMAYGTLGFMTAVKLPLIKAGNYVKLEYHPSHSIAQTEALLKRTENEFIEGIAYGKHNSVVTLGNFADKAEPGKVNHVNRWHKRFYYQHSQSFLNKSKVKTEYVPTRDYYHRHTRGIFWALQDITITHTRIFYFFFGWIFPVNFQFGKCLIPQPKWAIDLGMKYGMGQDFVVPIQELEESLTLCHDLTEIYPIWLCPARLFNRPGLVHMRDGHDGYYIDIGLYGKIPFKKVKQLGSSVEAVKRFEQFNIEKNGFQGMYTDCYLSKEDFYKMFNGELYNKMRKQLNCLDAFPDVYEKISVYYKQN